MTLRTLLFLPVLAATGLAVLMVGSTPAADPPDEDETIILFSYFEGNGESGVYLQTSDDGLTFEAVNNGQPIFSPPDSSWPENQRLTRDPSILYQNGTFHMVWTTNWEGRVFGYARSPDLQDWSEPRLVRPFPEERPEHRQPNNVWAPELHHDPVNDRFFVVFSSTVPERLDEHVDPHGHNHRMYVTRTEDFETFTDAELFYDPGFNSIDGQAVYQAYGSPDVKDDRWITVFKDERPPEHGGKNLRLAFRDPKTGAFTDYSAPIVGPGSGLNEHWAEGPTLLKTANGGWNLYWDAYRAGYYGLAQSRDLKTWTDATGRLEIDVDHPRHGSFFRAPASAVEWETGE
jgi:hypothetical protein